MPPKSRRGGAAAARKAPATRGRVGRAQATADEAPPAEEVNEALAEEAPKVVEEPKRQPSPPPQQPAVEEKGSDANHAGDEGAVKETYEEEDKGERLEFEDEPEYEEEAAVDYDEKDLEQYEEQYEDGDEEVEYTEDVVEVETDMVDEELDEGADDGEGEGYENADEEHQVDVDDEEHNEMVKEHRKRKEFEVFVGGLDKDATENDLRKVFGEVGDITEVRLMMNPVTKKNKGFAFLRYATVEQARRAVSELKNPLVRGKQCGVAPSHDNDTLFVGNICKTWTKEHVVLLRVVFMIFACFFVEEITCLRFFQLKDKLKSYGVENFDDLLLVEDSNNPGMNRGYALLEFSTRPEAMDAFRILQKRDVVFGVDRSAKVSFADSYPQVDDEIMAQVRTVFIDGLSPSWDEDRVKKYLKKYGAIEKVELARNMPAAKRKDFGFVTFDTHDNAVACAEGINNYEIGEGDHKAKVRARLSRPLQRPPRMKHGLRGNFRVGHGASRGGRLPYARPPPPRRPPPRLVRPAVSRLPPIRSHPLKRPVDIRDRQPVMSMSDRARRLPPPERSYDRRPPAPVYPKRSPRREYGRRDDLPPPRSRAAIDYSPRVPVDRRPSFRDDYSPRGSGYSDLGPRSAPRLSDRRAYPDDSYGGKFDRPLPAYRESRGRDYDTISGSKRPYADMDDTPRYQDISVRQSKARLDYDVGGSSARYGDTYSERPGRSHVAYSGSRSISGHDSAYGSSRHGMSYGGSNSSGDAGGMYPSSYSGSYTARGSDVGGSSYSSLYSGRNLGSNSGGYYGGGSGSGSYY
ncbi:Heterogeneous nuclear ribonucleoprotein Q [Dichanthelium oligosanthes]|uniref:Heterogeneous nuclear ribonucleoprotein Q n=1 Tax=Dichanthelium oligosanthes TaxID=888268 RepID=A0A1E5V1Q8_9POAL|nr:Heterogeneous nuclear ribonucleoprotein Q [Dichanthelium oligosanthes]